MSCNNYNNYIRSPLYRGNVSARNQAYINNATEAVPSASCPCQESDCNPGDSPVDTMEVGMSYIPWQNWDNLYDPKEALSKGTVFADLYKPWIGRDISNE